MKPYLRVGGMAFAPGGKSVLCLKYVKSSHSWWTVLEGTPQFREIVNSAKLGYSVLRLIYEEESKNMDEPRLTPWQLALRDACIEYVETHPMGKGE